MKSEILELKHKALLMGLCGEYKAKWDSCTNKEELMDLALDINGVEFLSDAFAFGWGVSAEYMEREFYDYIHGQYHRKKEGYTSCMLYGNTFEYTLNTTITLLVDSNCQVLTGDYFAGRLFVSGTSKVGITNGGYLELYVYGDRSNVVVKNVNGGTFKRKDILESQWRGCHEAKDIEPVQDRARP